MRRKAIVNKGKGKGPGKSYRKGMTLMDLFDMFPDDAAAERWVIETRWPDGMRCPRCEGENVAARRHPTMPYHCADCRKRFSTKTGTVMEGSNLGYRRWAIAVYVATTNIKGTSSRSYTATWVSAKKRRGLCYIESGKDGRTTITTYSPER